MHVRKSRVRRRLAQATIRVAEPDSFSLLSTALAAQYAPLLCALRYSTLCCASASNVLYCAADS